MIAASVAVVILYLLGAFDYPCIKYSSFWYCNGPMGVHPIDQKTKDQMQHDIANLHK